MENRTRQNLLFAKTTLQAKRSFTKKNDIFPSTLWQESAAQTALSKICLVCCRNPTMCFCLGFQSARTLEGLARPSKSCGISRFEEREMVVMVGPGRIELPASAALTSPFLRGCQCGVIPLDHRPVFWWCGGRDLDPGPCLGKAQS